MEHQARYCIVLAKEDFKFSAAHFTLFPDGSAELLHGHNYHIQVELAGEELDEWGLLCDLREAKQHIRAACEGWDSLTLIPLRSPHLEVSEQGDGVEIRYRDRRYRFPRQDVLLLPLENTSIELFALLLWRQLAPSLAGGQVTWLAVTVAETAGQSCRYGASLPGVESVE